MKYKNKALVLKKPYQLSYEEIELPQMKENEVLIRILYVALCGSDVKMFKGEYAGANKLPLIIGHEWVGEIISVGREADSEWQIGDIVTGDCSLYCNDCDMCLSDKNQCEKIEKRGITLNGACSTYIVSNPQYIYHCPQIINKQIYSLAEPMAVVIQALKKVGEERLKRISNALIVGAGGIGVMALFALKKLGIKDIVITDKIEKKLDMVAKLKVDTIKIEPNLVYEENRYDLIMEASGNSSILKDELKALNKNGYMVCIGHQTETNVDFEVIIKKALNISGSIGGTGSFNEAIEIINHYSEIIQKAITEIVPVDCAVDFFYNNLNNPNIKVVLDFTEGGAKEW